VSTEPGIHDDLEQYPGGILEKQGSIPLFLKLTYVGFTIFGILYFLMYLAGDGSSLVEVYNRATGVGTP